MKKLYEAYPDLIIMARELPLVNGEDPCLRIREACYLPIIAVGAAEEAVEILELGADAYVTKPVNLRELVARVQTLLRRKLRHNPPGDNSGSEIENQLNQEGNRPGGLTGTEFHLAACLLFNQGKLVDYGRLIAEVWAGKPVSRDTLHFYIRRLRRKLQAFLPDGIRILSYRGVGYRLEEVGQSQRDSA
ncbi:MAG: response regulator transcription factor [Chloroflexi bacterium]|nr:response regulator transcription factor [Chloroflexota bacterium]